ncbi:MAG: hypothetical protein AAGA58_07265 [Verrucomicrobiota bacterium]
MKPTSAALFLFMCFCSPVPAVDWGEKWAEFPQLKDDPESQFLQSLRLFATYQHQFIHVEGTDQNGNDFHDAYEEARRVWWGASGEAFHWWKYKFVSNAARDRGNFPGGSHQWGHENFRSANIAFQADKALKLGRFDSFDIGYGRRSARMAEEWQRSAYWINTVERSDFSNKLWPNDEGSSNPLAAWTKFQKGIHEIDLAVFSTDDSDWIPGWEDGVMFFASWEGDYSKHTGLDVTDIWLSAFHQDADPSGDQLANGIENAAAFTTRVEDGPWMLRTTLGIGDNGEQSRANREGTFWGGVVQPMYWLIDEKLKFLFRYQYQASDRSEGIRLDTRYARIAEANGIADINGGRGDEHHSVYFGLNWYFDGENKKVVFGTKYDDISTNGDTVYRGWTTGVGLRIHF